MRTRIAIVVGIVALVVSSCPRVLPPEMGSGSLVVTIAGASDARTLAPGLDMTPADYVVQGTHSGGATFAQTVSVTARSAAVERLTPGEWTVIVDARNADTPIPTVIGRGTKSVTVVANLESQVDITVLPLGGAGALSLSLTWMGSAEGVTLRGSLTRLSEGTDAPIPFELPGGTATYVNAEVGAGYYTLDLQLLQGTGVVAGAVEAVRIVSGETTEGTIALMNATEGGSAAVVATVDRENPLQVSIGRGGTATSDNRSYLHLGAFLAGSTAGPLYFWYVNGGGLPAGSQVDGSTLRLPPSLEVGDYRVDVVAFAPGSGQVGSASVTIGWQGQASTAPTPVAGLAYHNTQSGTSYVVDGAGWRTSFSELVVTVATAGADYQTIQAAVDAAGADAGSAQGYGYTIGVAAGTYDGTIDITRAVTVMGAGSGTDGTVLVNTAAQGDFTNLPRVYGGTFGAYRPTVIVSASGTAEHPVVLRNLRIGPRQNIGYPRPAILLRPGAAADSYAASYSHLTLDGIRVVGHVQSDTSASSANEWGLTIDDATSLDHLVVQDSEFTDNRYGMIFFKSTANTSTVRNAVIRNTIFARNSIKGFYAEKLSDTTFDTVWVLDNGDVTTCPTWARWSNAGVDINLKLGDYQNLTFIDLTVSGNGKGSYAGAGLVVKARGTGTDNAEYSATLTGVLVSGGVYTGNIVGIRFGEVAAAWPEPAAGTWDLADFQEQSFDNTSPTNVTVRGVRYIGNTGGMDLVNTVDGLTIAAE